MQAAAGSVVDSAQLIDRHGDALGSGTVSPLAYGIDAGAPRALNPLRATAGRLPAGGGEVAIDAAAAEDGGYRVGDTIRVAAGGPARDYRIAGLVQLGDSRSVGGATITVFDLATAQDVFGKDGRLDVIRVDGAAGVGRTALTRAIAPHLPAAAQVRTGAAQARAESNEVRGQFAFLRYLLLAFGAVALFVGSFVIANTLSITIAQRTRELATVRTLGGSRRQVLASVVLEALLVGLAASVAGLFLGLGLAKGLSAMMTAAGIDIPADGTVLAGRTVAVSLIVGVLITLLASVRPAVRATRVPPIAAVREGATLPESRFARFGPGAALAVLGVAVAILALGMFAGGLTSGARLGMTGLGAILLFVGVALVAPRLVRPLTAVLGWPSARIGGTAGRLAGANASRNPSRTASTAAALMIGLALVTFVAILANGLKSNFVDAVDELFTADYALTAETGFTPPSPAVEAALARAPGVSAVTGVRAGTARIDGRDVPVSATGPGLARTIHQEWYRGSDAVPARLGRDGVMITRSWAQDEHLSVGSPVTLATPTGDTLRLTVRGIWEEPKGGSPVGNLTISTEAFDRAFPKPRNDMTFVEMDGGVSAANTAALERALAEFPNAELQTRRQFTDAQVAMLANTLNILYVLLALSVIVSLFGIVNTLVLTVFERTRELGMLRAIGMTRRQVRQMIRHESIVTALLGAALGIVAGMFLAALVTQALGDQGFSFAVPAGTLLVFVLAAVMVGIVAAVLPARRASRLNVLDALQHE